MAEEYLKKHRKRLTTEAAEFFCVQNRRRFENGFFSSDAGNSSTGPLSRGTGDFDLSMARSSCSANDFPSIVATAETLSFGCL